MVPPSVMESSSSTTRGLRRAGAAVGGRLRAVVLLAGSVRSTSYLRAVGRSVLGLPMDEHRTLLDLWREQCEDLAWHADLPQPLAMRAMLDRSTAKPPLVETSPRLQLGFENDPGELRGTGGLVSDVAMGFADDDFLVVVTAAQLMLTPLAELVDKMAGLGGDACVVSHADGTPSSVILIRAGCLRQVSRIGFVDLKEQALPAIAKKHSVRVLDSPMPTALSLRTLAGYVAAVREHHERLAGIDSDHDPFAEDWRSTFQLVERGAQVHRGARVHDSVVLGGARVEDGAVVVRSVVAPGGVVERGQMAVETLVASADSRVRRAVD